MTLYCFHCADTIDSETCPCCSKVETDYMDRLVETAQSRCETCGLFTLATGDYCQHCATPQDNPIPTAREAMVLELRNLTPPPDYDYTPEVTIKHALASYQCDMQILFASGVTGHEIAAQLRLLAEGIENAMENPEAEEQGDPYAYWFSRF